MKLSFKRITISLFFRLLKGQTIVEKLYERMFQQLASILMSQKQIADLVRVYVIKLAITFVQIIKEQSSSNSQNDSSRFESLSISLNNGL
jgi:hypothetical protein